MSEAKKGNKVLLYYNAYSGSGVFKNNLDYIVERCQEEGFQVVPVRASKGYVIEETLANLEQNEYDRIIAAGYRIGDNDQPGGCRCGKRSEFRQRGGYGCADRCEPEDGSKPEKCDGNTGLLSQGGDGAPAASCTSGDFDDAG